MHRSAARHTTLTPVERESRRRTWWVLYFFDRFSASKLGQPITVRDEDIDVEMPSMDGLAEEEMAEFLDPQSLINNIKLARIIGNMRESCLDNHPDCHLTSCSHFNIWHTKDYKWAIYPPSAWDTEATSGLA